MNYIQEKSNKVAWFTSLIDVFDWLEIKAEDYDWHFSDVVGGWAELNDPAWVKGEELAKNLAIFNYQFDWAVISAYPKGAPPFTSEMPYADGNPDFWSSIPKKQLSDSLFEIVCWDNSATLFIDLPANLQEKLLKNAPDIKDLNTKNKWRIFLKKNLVR